jgi:hypothetical protein
MAACAWVQISLVEQPHLSYSLNVQGGDITFLPGLELFINNLLRDIVMRPYIVPDGYTLPLVPGGGREARQHPHLMLFLHGWHDLAANAMLCRSAIITDKQRVHSAWPSRVTIAVMLPFALTFSGSM